MKAYKVYIDLISMNLKSQMQYKMSFVLTIFGQFITAFTSYFGLAFIMQKVNSIDGFTHGQVLLCFAIIMLSFAIGEMFGGGFATFAKMLGNGEFDRIMIRPRNVILQIVVPNLDFTRLGLLLQAVLVMGYAIPASKIDWDYKKIIIFCLMIIAGSGVFFGLFLVKAACSFFTVESVEFLNIFTYGARQFGRYPFSVYGNTILKFLTFVIPLALFQYYPLLYLTEREKNILFAVCPAISLLFLVPCFAFFYLGIRHFKSTGS